MKVVRRVLVLLALLLVALWLLVPGGPTLAPGSILVLELSGEYLETAEPSFLDRLLAGRRRPFVSLLSELEKARRDDRLAGVVLRVRELGIDWGMAQELRDALGELREAGRPTLAYLETGGLGANLEYYVASAADRVVVSPGSSSPLVGLAMEFLFLGGMWEKLGAGFEAIGSGEYKSAAETIAGREMSPAHREMATSLLDSLWAQFVAGIASGRGLDEAAVRRAIDRAPVAPEELVELRLADSVEDFDAAVASLGSGERVAGDDYRAVDPASVGFAPKARFALVYGSGAVVVGSGHLGPAGSPVLASDTVGEAIERAAEDAEVAAIVLRIDSPGGSPLASEIVWSAAEKARAAGKPVVASVSNVAASGGYYVLCGADAVVASPGSLVGSIGVFAVRPVIGGLLEKLGIGVESMTRGAHADLLLASRPLRAAARERLRADIDGIYDLFVQRVAAGRGLSVEAVDAVGRGRVWTGEQALGRGLVDELGGLRTAVRRAKVLAGLDPAADVELVTYPPPRSLAEQVSDALREARLAAQPRLPLPGLLRRLEALADALPEGVPLLVPPLLVEVR
jgi:protease-4